jgi:hypothetical protein
MSNWKLKIGKAKQIAVKAKTLHCLVRSYKAVQDGVDFSIMLFALDYWVRRLVGYQAALYHMAADLYGRHLLYITHTLYEQPLILLLESL